jgi:NADPH-dependent 2,4-dienoyl-CoA reductase/sulfur reductase-like enzyme
VYTAGVAQAYMNLHNLMVGRRAVILGSGDIGMIMARRLTLEGASVEGVYEILPHPSGLPRNVAQCLDDFGIPLHLSHTVVDVRGSARLESVTVAQVDGNLLPIPGIEREIPCDTLILSVGLIPENELSLQAGVALHPRTRGPLVDEFFRTSVEGIFAAGNVLQVHDLVDFVSLEAESLATSVARHLAGRLPEGSGIEVRAGEGVGYVLPARIGGNEDFTLSLRVKRPARDVALRVALGGRTIKTVKLPKVLPAEMLRVKLRAADLGASAALVTGANGTESLEVSLLC